MAPRKARAAAGSRKRKAAAESDSELEIEEEESDEEKQQPAGRGKGTAGKGASHRSPPARTTRARRAAPRAKKSKYVEGPTVSDEDELPDEDDDSFIANDEEEEGSSGGEGSDGTSSQEEEENGEEEFEEEEEEEPTKRSKRAAGAAAAAGCGTAAAGSSKGRLKRGPAGEGGKGASAEDPIEVEQEEDVDEAGRSTIKARPAAGRRRASAVLETPATRQSTRQPGSSAKRPRTINDIRARQQEMLGKRKPAKGEADAAGSGRKGRLMKKKASGGAAGAGPSGADADLEDDVDEKDLGSPERIRDLITRREGDPDPDPDDSGDDGDGDEGSEGSEPPSEGGGGGAEDEDDPDTDEDDFIVDDGLTDEQRRGQVQDLMAEVSVLGCVSHS